MIIMPINAWSSFKSTVVTEKQLAIQYAESSDRYDVYASEAGVFVWNICLLKNGGSDVLDFENNYKAAANKRITDEVMTQAEKNDKDKKISKASKTVNVNTVGCIFIKCPGSMNLDGDGNPIDDAENDRWVNGGSIICNNAVDGDYIEVFVTADNNASSPTIVKSFTEDQESSDGKNGWYMDSVLGSVDLESAAPAHLYAGFYLCIKYHAVGGLTARKVYVNIDWDLKQ